MTMTAARIRITIDPLGNPVMKGEGFVGTACKAAMKPIEDAFAGGVASTTEETSAYMTPIVEDTQTIQTM